MLANGAKLYIKTTGVDVVPSTFDEASAITTELTGLKEIPDLGMNPEKVDNTCLTDKIMQYELGIGDPGDMEYRFKLTNNASTDAYRVLRTAEAGGKIHAFKEVLKDGTTSIFYAFVTVRRNGGGVNGVLDFTLGLALQSEIEITDPAVSGTSN